VRYANNSNYRNDSLIRKESECPPLTPEQRIKETDRCAVCVSQEIVKTMKKIIKQSEIMK
jgi:hypothetical protein